MNPSKANEDENLNTRVSLVTSRSHAEAAPWDLENNPIMLIKTKELVEFLEWLWTERKASPTCSKR